MFYIDPLKEETMSLKPWLALYHDVISEREMAVVKELAVPKVNNMTSCLQLLMWGVIYLVKLIDVSST